MSLETEQLKEALITPPHNLTIHIVISLTLHSSTPLVTYHIHYAHIPHTYSHAGGMMGIDQMQAISQAVEAALCTSLTIPHNHTYLWLQPKTTIPHLLTLKTHRDTHITYNTHVLLSNILT